MPLRVQGWNPFDQNLFIIPIAWNLKPKRLIMRYTNFCSCFNLKYITKNLGFESLWPKIVIFLNQFPNCMKLKTKKVVMSHTDFWSCLHFYAVEGLNFETLWQQMRTILFIIRFSQDKIYNNQWNIYNNLIIKPTLTKQI